MARTPAPKKRVGKKERADEPFYRPFSKLRPAKDAAKKGKAKPTATPPARSDAETFAIYMAGVRELTQRGVRIPATASGLERAAPSPPAADRDEPARESMRSLVSDGLRFETVDDGERLEGRRLEVDPRELRRLRRGQYAIDGKLDLHGMSLEDARRAVEAFVKKRQTDGDRVVLVVHGKGSHSPRGLAVLRGEIAAWLSQGRAARHVAAFATAPEEQGGSGALLVLLAR
jgi:DNA-nicking Smr family endonuclease